MDAVAGAPPERGELGQPGEPAAAFLAHGSGELVLPASSLTVDEEPGERHRATVAQHGHARVAAEERIPQRLALPLVVVELAARIVRRDVVLGLRVERVEVAGPRQKVAERQDLDPFARQSPLQPRQLGQVGRSWSSVQNCSVRVSS